MVGGTDEKIVGGHEEKHPSSCGGHDEIGPIHGDEARLNV
jgi:hypothetical protein